MHAVWGNFMNRVIVEINKSDILNYEIVSIMHDKPFYLIPMSFIEMEDVYKIIYDTSGYVSLNDIVYKFSANDVLTILHEIVNIFKVSHMNLLFPERFRISTETVFFDPEKSTIKIMFMPSEECKSLNKKIIEFIEEIKCIDITKGAEDYLDTLKSYLEHNPSLYNLKKSLVTYKREIVLCGIE